MLVSSASTVLHLSPVCQQGGRPRSLGETLSAFTSSLFSCSLVPLSSTHSVCHLRRFRVFLDLSESNWRGLAVAGLECCLAGSSLGVELVLSKSFGMVFMFINQASRKGLCSLVNNVQ